MNDLQTLNNNLNPDVKPYRQADHVIDDTFLNRWSPRAFSPEPIDEETILRVFEAARWAASSFNEQPWRFLLARSEEDRAKFLSFLTPSNKTWAKNAPVLYVIITKKTFSHNGSPNGCHQFDAGTASGYITFQAAQLGLITHGMAGFDKDQARATLGIPTDFEIMAVFALGKHGDKSVLSPEVQEREVPSGRRPVHESIMESHFVDAKEKQAEEDTENDG